MDYLIVPTVGPSTDLTATLRAIRRAGADAFRLNTSHVSLEAVVRWVDRFDDAFGGKPPVSVVFDLQGSKWRLGDFSGFSLRAGHVVELICAREARGERQLPVPHVDFFATTAGSTEIVLHDAKIRLQIESRTPNMIRARVLTGGDIAPNQGITLTGSNFRKESLSERDAAIVARLARREDVRYAISYVKDAAEMANYRKQLGDRYLIAKLERASALADVSGIAKEADELWLCRGDLGAEVGLRAMAEGTDAVAGAVRSLPVPTLLAGQVLEHMTEHPTPTRSEVCYLHHALRVGFAGVVLSDETAIGRYPVEACRVAAMFR